jgi:hypothetical protein
MLGYLLTKAIAVKMSLASKACFDQRNASLVPTTNTSHKPNTTVTQINEGASLDIATPDTQI